MWQKPSLFNRRFIILMIVFKIQIKGITFLKPESNPSVGPDGDTPCTFPFAFQPMQVEGMKVHIFGMLGCIQLGQNISHSLDHFLWQPSRIILTYAEDLASEDRSKVA